MTTSVWAATCEIGSRCDGQVQVWHDLLSYSTSWLPQHMPRHVKQYAKVGEQIEALLAKLNKDLSLTEREKKDLENLPSTLMICHLNGFDDAKQKLIEQFAAAWNAAQLFDGPTVAIVKHTVPCGLAVRDSLVEAYRAAYEGDTVSAFGGIVAGVPFVDTLTTMLDASLPLTITEWDEWGNPADDPETYEGLATRAGCAVGLHIFGIGRVGEQRHMTENIVENIRLFEIIQLFALADDSFGEEKACRQSGVVPRRPHRHGQRFAR